MVKRKVRIEAIFSQLCSHPPAFCEASNTRRQEGKVGEGHEDDLQSPAAPEDGPEGASG